MHRLTRLLVLASSLCGLAEAADQTLLGSQLAVKNPGVVGKRKVVVVAKELAGPNTIVGDPVANGASLTITLHGATPGTESFALPTGTSALSGKPFWSGSAAEGYKYKDPKAENGPVKGVLLKNAGGAFKLGAVALGKLAPLALVPPNPGTDGCVLLAITGGDSYSVAFVDGTITNKGTALFKVKHPVSEATCVVSSTDADGDGVLDALDNCPTDPNPTQDDSDADGHGDVCDACPLVPNPGPNPCPTTSTSTTTSTTLLSDGDGDGVPDIFDNCPADPNPTQADLDADGHGDVCDACPLVPNPGPNPCPTTSTSTSTSTTLLADADGDGVPDAIDNCPAVSNVSQVDTDADAHGDACDACPFIPNPGPAPCPTPTLVINEVDYDQIGADIDEFVEILNVGPVTVDLTGISLVLVNGATGLPYLTVSLGSAGVVNAGGTVVVATTTVVTPVGVPRVSFASASSNIQNGAPDGVALVDTVASTLLDALSYEGSITSAAIPGLGTVGLVEGTPLPISTADSDTVAGSLCRLPNGSDTNDAATDWTFCGTPSPGATNIP